MTPDIDISRVKQVLLWHWHEIVPGTFAVGAYDPTQLPTGGTPAAGATWKERSEPGDRERTIFCPLAAIKAVSYGWEKPLT